MWDLIMETSKRVSAPIDVFAAKDKGTPDIVDQEDKNLKAYHTLIGLMLSSQTRNEVTHATMRYLVKEKKITIDSILKTKSDTLNSWISKINFHNKKAVYIKKATEMIRDKHKG
jgi:endonuclease-3